MNTNTQFAEIPLFPLRSVLFPRGRLALQIFERRYIALVTESLRENTGFGVALLKSGQEVIKPGTKQVVHRTGTYARIVDWDQLENGLLGITVEGTRKFRVQECRVAANELLMARVVFSDHDTVEEQPIPMIQEYHSMTELLQVLERHPAVDRPGLDVDHDNLWDVGWRLSELIPVELETRQRLLEVDDPWERLRMIEKTVFDLANEG
ncbi:MAG: LON peptidase substrate-binding domain-containing protein [Pseudohongiellaceae bacterium]